MKSIMYHTWEPGLEGNLKTSGGGAVWTRFLWKQLERYDYSIQYFQKEDVRPLDDPNWKPAIMPDVAIFCWRWMLPNVPQYAERNFSYERQNALIRWCIRNKIPFFIHDQDLKMSDRERDFILYNDGKIATPSFFPERDEVSLHFPNPYKFRKFTENRPNDLVYIGNNYERLDQTVRLIQKFSERVHTSFYGNWVEAGPGRNPEQITGLFPHVDFRGRLDQSLVIEELSKSRGTVMLHKEEYGPRGFTTIRWAETAAAGVLPFIPSEFQLPSIYKPLFNPLCVSDGDQMLWRYAEIKKEDEYKIIQNVRKFVDTFMRAEPWLRLIERMSNGR